MFGSIFKSKEKSIFTPFKGRMIDIEAVPDQVLSKELLGNNATLYAARDILKHMTDTVDTTRVMMQMI